MGGRHGKLRQCSRGPGRFPETGLGSGADAGPGSINLGYAENTFRLSGDKTSYLVLGERSEQGAFHLIAIIPENAILQQLPYLKRLTVIVTIGACVFPLLLVWYLRKVFLQPILRIVAAMRRFGDGNWRTRLELGKGSMPTRTCTIFRFRRSSSRTSSRTPSNMPGTGSPASPSATAHQARSAIPRAMWWRPSSTCGRSPGR